MIFFIGVALIIVLGIMAAIGVRFTEAILRAVILICFGIPVALLLFGIGLICCCTIILIPFGIKLFALGCTCLTLGS